MNPRSMIVCILTLAAGLGACRRADPTGPPDVRLGRDECAECGMLINEDRSSCALLVSRDGVKEHALFDDIGCLLEFINEHAAGRPVIEAWVRDHSTREWMRAETASFLFVGDNRLPTPMASGIAAFGSREGANEAMARLGGDIVDWARVAVERRAWMEARYGRPLPRP